LVKYNQDIIYELQKSELTEEDKKRYENLQEALDSLKAFSVENYVSNVDKFYYIQQEYEVKNI
jgi:hypothetical protein